MSRRSPDGEFERPHKRPREDDDYKYKRHGRFDTPSHPGGVNDDALDRISRRKENYRRRGDHVEAKYKDGYRSRDDNRSSSTRDDSRSDPRNSARRDDKRRNDWDRTPQRSPRGSNWESPSPLIHHTPQTPLNLNHMIAEPSPRATPSHKYNKWEKKDVTSSTKRTTNHNKEFGWDGDQVDELDLEWYNAEESEAVDEALQDKKFLGDSDKFTKKEQEYKKQRGSNRVSARKSQILKDNEAWEENRMMTSGIARMREVQVEFNEEDDQRVHIIVHDVKPPFLDAQVTLDMTGSGIIQPVVDPTSDMATIARKGSFTLREVRSQRERMKSVKSKFNMSGTNLGNIMGIKQQVEKTINETIQDQLGPIIAPIKSDVDKNHISDKKKQLPIYYCRDELLTMIRENNVVVIVGETGSGKTTQMTQYLHQDGYTKYGRIACTQPRRVAAMSVAKRVSEEVGCELGTTVGYAIRFEDVTSDDTLIKYMTDGVLLRESLHEKDLDQYSVIIMDEAHERSLNTDVLFGILRKIVSRRRDLKLIVTSATMDANKFSTFFGGVPVYTIPGRTYPVDVLYTKTPVTDYVEAAVKQAMAIHLSTPPEGDILIFMTGQEDIEVTCYILEQKVLELDDDQGRHPKLSILPIYSMLPSELQARIFTKSEKGNRKCIVATNIAETSLTVDGILYVIDTGYSKLKVFNPKVGMDALQVYPESRAAANQRSGRAGRTGPGRCYRLFTEIQYNTEMLANTVPEIQRTNLGNVVLLLKSLGIKNLLEFGFMDPPPQDNMKNSMYQLWILGALDGKGELTGVGKKMTDLPLDPPLAKMVIAAQKMGCVSEVLTVVSMLSVPTVFYRPKDREEESDATREKFFVPESDHLTLLYVYQQWKQHDYSMNWCNDHFIHYKAMRKVQEIRNQIADIIKKNGMQLTTCGQDWDVVRKAICSGYFHHAARLQGIGEYRNMLTGMPCILHPTSALYGMGYTPDYVVYHELIMTSREYMQCVTSVDGSWLAEMAPTFFSVKKSHRTREEKRRANREEMEQVRSELMNEKQNEEQNEDLSFISHHTPQIVTPGRQQAPGTPRRTPRRMGL
ncbi:pre-mRNA-splicing factor ATP-dependent RNA helicase DHX38/PRP1 [Acrasis kona]|uniref:RNA helicase n=1 Tax=Acrasis kona TaxID=1008807 RepID=A0AAW2Z233_9EUKA